MATVGPRSCCLARIDTPLIFEIWLGQPVISSLCIVLESAHTGR